jgi:Subtilase family
MPETYEFDSYAVLTADELSRVNKLPTKIDGLIGKRINLPEFKNPRPLLIAEVPLLFYSGVQFPAAFMHTQRNSHFNGKNIIEKLSGLRKIDSREKGDSTSIAASGFDKVPESVLNPPQSTKYNGKGVRIAVLDTGFEFNVKSARKSVVDIANFGTDSTLSENFGTNRINHGTRVATVIAGTPTSVAPNATLFLAKIYSGAMSSLVYLMLGICWAVKKGCAIVNVSSYFARSRTDGVDLALNAVVAYAFRNNCLVLAAIGNGNINGPNPDGLSMLSVCNQAIAVAGLFSGESNFESDMQNPDLHESIDCAAPYGAVKCWDDFSSTNPSYMFGTSGATAIASGCTALFAQKLLGLGAYEVLKALIGRCTNPNNLPRIGFGNVGVPI